MLKQGYYNFDFAVAGARGTAPDETYFEGSHYETENQYDLLVYYRPPGTRADLLIGYKAVDMNSPAVRAGRIAKPVPLPLAARLVFSRASKRHLLAKRYFAA